MKRMAAVVALAMLIAACGADNSDSDGGDCGGCSGGDVPAEFRLVLDVSGDTLEEFKVTHAKTSKPDFSSPRALVEDISKFMERGTGLQAQGDTVDEKFGEIVDALIESSEEKLLTADLIADLVDEREKMEKRSSERDEGKPETKHHPIEVSNEVKNDDGTVSLEVSQRSESFHKENDEWVMTERNRKERFTTVEIEDGTWRVSKHERWREDQKDETKGKWEESHILVQVKEMTHYKDRLKPISPIDNSTAEKAASAVVDSLFALSGFKFMGGTVFAMVAVEPLVELFFSDDVLKASEEMLKEELKKDDGWTGKPREFDSTSIDGDVTTIVFKLKDPDSKFDKSKLVLKLKKFDDGYKVFEGGTMRLPWNAEEGAKPEYKKAEKFTSLKWK
ncbi:MAG: hypothetical protein ACYTDT_05150 [Planctomycetota bacterium]|jgi:hypothetical protein